MPVNRATRDLPYVHFFDEIQGWFNFQRPYREALEAATDDSVFVELGCWKGKSAAFMMVEALRLGKNPKLHFVDHWGGSYELAHTADPDLTKIYEMFLENCIRTGYRNYDVHRCDSVKAADLFPDNSVDFLWIDAGHDYDSVRADIQAWLPKMKELSTIGGDDYPMEGVTKAVNEIFPKAEIGSEGGWKWWRVKRRP